MFPSKRNSDAKFVLRKLPLQATLPPVNWEHLIALWGLLVFLLQVAGIYYAIQAIMTARTPQSAIGWSLALIVLPIIAIPLFWIFGESKFAGYSHAGSGQNNALDAALLKCQEAIQPFDSSMSHKYSDSEAITRGLRHLGATEGNTVKLLIDGAATFESIFEEIDRAKELVVVQFYIIHDDGLGRALKERLLAAARRGVRCFVLYDSVGSKGITPEWIGGLRSAGVSVESFITNRQRGRRFQINFRNHRKLVIVDGKVAFIGGLNAGDEYLGKGPLGAWRDTHMRIEGPAVATLQVPFLEDWNYTTHTVPELEFRPEASGNAKVLTFPSSPAQMWTVASAVYLEIIHDVRERLWIASPYFVTDPATRTAIAHAALRGVDVRILLPANADHLLPWLSSFTYYPQMQSAGVRIWRYGPGFMHQKVLLADKDLSIVGSINLDFRSFMLNFELAAAVEDRDFATVVEEMFLQDFARAKEENLSSFSDGGLLFRFKCRLASLMSPEQ